MIDPEIAAMSAVADALTDLGEDERGRVLRWAAERYGAILALDSSPAPVEGVALTEAAEPSQDEISAEAPSFDHFADLFNAASPRTDPDKALVAGYWFQVIQTKSSFQALELNKELKHLGHAIGSVSKALASNMNKKPRRILQLRKSGTSRQARKTYKLTHEGMVYVQGMMSHVGD